MPGPREQPEEISSGVTKRHFLELSNAAKGFQPLSGTELAALRAKTQAVAQNGQYELYKTSHHFDTTEKKPEYLG